MTDPPRPTGPDKPPPAQTSPDVIPETPGVAAMPSNLTTPTISVPSYFYSPPAANATQPPSDTEKDDDDDLADEVKASKSSSQDSAFIPPPSTSRSESASAKKKKRQPSMKKGRRVTITWKKLYHALENSPQKVAIPKLAPDSQEFFGDVLGGSNRN